MWATAAGVHRNVNPSLTLDFRSQILGWIDYATRSFWYHVYITTLPSVCTTSWKVMGRVCSLPTGKSNLTWTPALSKREAVRLLIKKTKLTFRLTAGVEEIRSLSSHKSSSTREASITIRLPPRRWTEIGADLVNWGNLSFNLSLCPWALWSSPIPAFWRLKSSISFIKRENHVVSKGKQGLWIAFCSN